MRLEVPAAALKSPDSVLSRVVESEWDWTCTAKSEVFHLIRKLKKLKICLFKNIR